MAMRFVNPFPQFWSSSAAYSGGTLYFYVTGTSTPLAVYSDKALVTSIGTSIALNSAGRFATDVFLQNQDYKIVLQDSNAQTIWTADPVRGSDYTDIPLWSVGSGSPSGVVAGTAGSAGVMPSIYYDFTNNILYVCSTTGTTTTAVWTAVNASASTPAVPPPQGRLTLTSATPVLAADVTSATSVFYTPYTGSLVPIYNGASFTPTQFSELTLTLASQHALNTIYDVFVFSNSGVLTLATGPAWNNSGAGTGTRSTGAGTTQLSRVLGFYVNAVQITGRNGATTYTIGANLATYVGSIFIDGTAGQVTCHTSFGQSRKWGVWNAYNRNTILIKAGDSTATWAYNTATIRVSNNDSTNKITTFTGLAEETIEYQFLQGVAVITNNQISLGGIGYNSTSAFSGTSASMPNAVVGGGIVFGNSRYVVPPTLGINAAQCLEKGGGFATNTWQGTEASMLLTARYMG